MKITFRRSPFVFAFACLFSLLLSGASANEAWSSPVSMVSNLGRLAIGDSVHIVGHNGGRLIHRRSDTEGATWNSPTDISSATGNFPAMYGGFYCEATNLFLLTSDSDMDSSANAGGRQLDFRISKNNGGTWSIPVRVTNVNTPIFRVRMIAAGARIHIVGTSGPTTNGSLWYFRSENYGTTWTSRSLATNLGPYGGGQTVGVEGANIHVAYTKSENGPGGGPTLYMRSTDHGDTWSNPVSIGEISPTSSRQARVQIVAGGGFVFACWQREASKTGDPIPADRLGYNRSRDGGLTWEVARILPGQTGIDRNHQHIWLAEGGGVHILYRIGMTTADPAGYIFSPDYGNTWRAPEIAINTNAVNHPWAIVANKQTVFALTGPSGGMQLAAKRVLLSSTEKYNAWTEAYRLAGQEKLQTSAPASDGVANLIKFACGVPPRTPAWYDTSLRLPAFSTRVLQGAKAMEIRFKPDPAANVQVTGQVSNNFLDWNPGEGVFFDDGPFRVFRDSEPLGLGLQRFLRLGFALPSE